ncbi:unnamed protein product [Cyclocybe aegerita]|uniref:Uncharacterized protein n=1 Tax=Cyclocybe aegerita TaxID=1973307 RepID=A0A8S0X3A3_CYCAE|nr:unnamed protein product [Cyclocybe aegerita]
MVVCFQDIPLPSPHLPTSQLVNPVMLSIYPQPTALPSKDTSHLQLEVNELGNLNDAVQSFTTRTVHTGTSAVRLHCTIPTWSASTDTCLDLHDLQEVKARFLHFIHDLLQSLRSAGVSASYSLAPSSSPLCLVSQRPIDTEVLQKVGQCSNQFKRKQVTLIDLEDAPCLVIT